jgi:hypothetical protein
MTIDDDRIAYLEGDDRPGLDPGDRRALDDIRALLADRRIWDEPDAVLEQEVVTAVLAEEERAAEQARTERRVRTRRRLLSVAAAVAVVLAVATVTLRPWKSSGPAAQHFAMTLAPTSLAPRATGSASLTKTPSGWRIVVHSRGLTRLDRGRYYEAWLKNTAGTLVPIGTFNDARNVTLWAGVSPVDFPTLTVTIERADGDQTSSGQRVLLGTIDR